MTDILQRTKLIGTNNSGDYVHLETYVPFDGQNYHEWIVEELADEEFRLWRQHGYPESGILTYRADNEIGAGELVRAGYADAPRVTSKVENQ